MSSSQSNVWFSNPSSTYLTTSYSSNPERSGSSNSNPSANSSLSLQGYGNSSQSAYRINSQTYLPHHHSGDMTSASNYPHMSDIRSHPQPQSSLSASSSTAAVGGNSSSSGNSRSYANVVKQATTAPAINNNNPQQQDSDSQNYIALLPKQYQVQGSSSGGGIRISKGTLPGQDFNMSNAMNSRKSQRWGISKIICVIYILLINIIFLIVKSNVRCMIFFHVSFCIWNRYVGTFYVNRFSIGNGFIRYYNYAFLPACLFFLI